MKFIFFKLCGLIMTIVLAAIVVRAVMVAPPVHLRPESVRVAVEHLFAPEQQAPPKTEYKAAAIVPVIPEPQVPLPQDHKPAIAIIIDDMGLSLSGSRQAMKLPAAVTLAFLPYATRLDEQVAEAREHGHSLMLHMPMEPMGKENPGPGALLTALPLDEVRGRFNRALDSFEGFDGVNNHMGSRFTADERGMEAVTVELKKRALFFVDSRTSVHSLGLAIAQKHGVPSIGRDVFLDDVQTVEAVRAQLAAAERVARRKGYAVVIGHPHEVTLKTIEAWLPEAGQNGFVLVPVRDLVKTQIIRVNAP